MARCPKCGTEMANENQKFCISCGAPIQENPTEGANAGTDANDFVNQVKSGDVNGIIEQAKAGDKKTIGILVGAGVAVVAVVVLIGSLLFGGGGYMDPINKYMKALNSQSTDYLEVETALSGSKLGKIQRDMFQAYVDADAERWGESYDDMLDDGADSLEDFYDYADDEYGKWKITFEKKDAEKMDKDDIEEMTENMNDSFEYMYDECEDMLKDDDEIEDMADSLEIDEKDAEKIVKQMMEYCKFFAEGKVQDAYEVKGKFIIESEDGTFETDTVELRVAKINGSWIYFGSGDYIMFEDDDEYCFDKIASDLNFGSMTFGLY